MKRITILGCTGSIGLQTLDVIRRNRNDFAVAGLCCHSSIDIMERQIAEFGVTLAAVFDEDRARELRRRTGIEVLTGLEGIIELAELDRADMVLNALVGSIGILPTEAAIRSGKDVALANKETLVSAGDIIMARAREKGVSILPVDSEHSALFQCLNGENHKAVRRLLLTCSGGAFRDTPHEELQHMTAEDALKHPSWNMGPKITVDSATLMNKGFEVIEARMLFDTDYDAIDVVIHPQSIIHSLVEFVDNSVLAQLGYPDMRLPIQYALTYPERTSAEPAPLDLAALGALTFRSPDLDRFPCLAYAIEAGKTGGTMPCVLNAANEAAVQAFLAGRIGFMDIAALVREALDGHAPSARPDLDEIIELDLRIKRVMAEKLQVGDPCHG
ncbi:MAG TPA: 1-deoxy-D-xylulose-5-phosphate reductoisomerase [Spirochaetota bacterium]|nr:1-deoxy-D-xylulose-5-phosphate reductoisomerase [Spirochaetota bacterium]HPC39911.1 1-deoxy-D-xylulose-5-phosphate reductoisomerase [Spirochaetota bacterium]HQF08913.1 1-deoxy-D-xylulose-5-phosphate reductoisomerase [Spirochaetota bacterium]HQH97839.1 1-deoxy-D-xylulose-5-phosphate reductoisomerase [Spirochaetota bacterium]HQJ71529.1 1-deoxy-D-xylulose-5-phosphate reductoisomerase [Spirochaetota bacterium]